MAVPEATGVVVAGTGGARLARTLASLGWTAERVVLDPAGRLDAEPLPPGVRRVAGTELAGVSGLPWLVVLLEGESAAPGLEAVVARAVALPGGPSAYRVEQELEGFGAVLRLRGAPIRVVRRESAVLDLERGAVGIAVREPRPGDLGGSILVHTPASVSELVDEVNVDAGVGAAVLAARGAPAALGRSIGASLGAAVRVVGARSVRAGRRPPAGWGHARWPLAMVAAYRALVVYAKLWERLHGAGALPA